MKQLAELLVRQLKTLETVTQELAVLDTYPGEDRHQGFLRGVMNALEEAVGALEEADDRFSELTEF